MKPSALYTQGCFLSSSSSLSRFRVQLLPALFFSTFFFLAFSFFLLAFFLFLVLSSYSPFFLLQFICLINAFFIYLFLCVCFSSSWCSMFCREMQRCQLFLFSIVIFHSCES